MKKIIKPRQLSITNFQVKTWFDDMIELFKKNQQLGIILPINKEKQ